MHEKRGVLPSTFADDGAIGKIIGYLYWRQVDSSKTVFVLGTTRGAE